MFIFAGDASATTLLNHISDLVKNVQDLKNTHSDVHTSFMKGLFRFRRTDSAWSFNGHLQIDKMLDQS